MSKIYSWDTGHLQRAATDWAATAEHWEVSFTALHRGTFAPGGAEWEGRAAEAAQERTSSDLAKVRGLAASLRKAAAVARRGASDLDGLKRRAIEAITETRAAGFGVDEDLSVTYTNRQTQAHVHAAMIAERVASLGAADRAIAAKITTATADLADHRFNEPVDDGTVQAVDFKTAPPPPPYPVNEVIAEATDLDGNHVVLRRGYYDAITKQGFGWDKAYWRHGVVNANVFKDLISHSRPIANDGGTLVYEVPINRSHCTKGFLGIVDCEDTGESLTMRIVANVNEGNPTVPDGGQKGVITMFPLKGGSGVTEIGPNWTWTPPWVNNNVPIN
jgi:hypothetical protein